MMINGLVAFSAAVQGPDTTADSSRMPSSQINVQRRSSGDDGSEDAGAACTANRAQGSESNRTIRFLGSPSTFRNDPLTKIFPVGVMPSPVWKPNPPRPRLKNSNPQPMLNGGSISPSESSRTIWNGL